ncbi:MAG: hypothetical protein OSJ76_01900 [Alphaproteobacteria bacterium]|nr:hypothetical protein [Alphaproteobacteria bacterium]
MENLIDGNPAGSPPPEVTNGQEEQVCETTAQVTPIAEGDAYLDAPKSYKQEYAETFRTLPPEMRKYLHQREKEMEQGVSKYQERLNSYKWLDNVYQPRQERLRQAGINHPQEWYETLAAFDDALNSDPQSVVKTLAEAYGVSFDGSESQESQLRQEINQLKQGFSSLKGFIANQRQAELKAEIQNFIDAKDDSGALVHPHFDKVKHIMGKLMTSAAVKNIQEAYDQAVWLDPEIRQQLMAAQSEARLKSKVEEAAKAKEAGFDPKGKAIGAAPELSTRELLEQQFAALE